MRTIERQSKGDYPEYAEMYMKLVPAGANILEHLKDNFPKVKDFIYALPEEKLTYRYAGGKWSIKEILVHTFFWLRAKA